VNILFFTDKQYERIISFRGRAKDPAKKAPDQYLLF
jgi:CRISPR-associated protein Cas2